MAIKKSSSNKKENDKLKKSDKKTINSRSKKIPKQPSETSLISSENSKSVPEKTAKSKSNTKKNTKTSSEQKKITSSSGSPMDKDITKKENILSIQNKEETGSAPKKNVHTSLKNKVMEILNKEREPVPSENSPFLKIKNILISQPQPKEPEKNPYVLLCKKYNISPFFCPFVQSVPLTAHEFRSQKIDISQHGAVILTSKTSLEFFFKICQESRITLSEDMKYFCINEQTAHYLQKFINYKKRKVFYGKGTLPDLVDVIKKNQNEKFLVPVSENHQEKILKMLDLIGVNYTKGIFYRTIYVNVKEKIKDLRFFDVLVFFTSTAIKSLMFNFPDFKQENIRMAAFGKAAGNALLEQGFRLDIYAPTPNHPNMPSALEAYIKKANKR